MDDYYLEELGKKPCEKILHIDSPSVIHLVKNTVLSKTKHIKRRRLVEDGDVFGEDRGCKEFSKHADNMC